MSLPYTFWSDVEKKLKYVLYGDSVAAYSKTVIAIDSEILYIDFDNIWNILVDNKFDIELKNNHEYIKLNNRIKILSYDITSDKIIMRQPSYIMRHKFKGNLIRLNLTNMTSIDVTKNHSLIEYRNDKLHKLAPELANYVAVCRNNLYLNDFKYEILPFLFGLWLSNGSLTYAQNNPYASFSFYEKDLTVQKIKTIDINNEITNIYNKNNWDILINYPEFTEMLLDYGYDRLNSPDRLIHTSLKEKLKVDRNLFISFIIGYYIGDGSYTTNLISFSTASLQLAEDIVELFMYYGIYSHIICDKNGRNYKDKIKGNMYAIKIVAMPINLLNLLKSVENLKGHVPIEEHSLYYGKGNSPLNNGCIVRKKSKCKIYNIKPIKIQSKEEIVYDGYVYDFEVPETHNFIINGVLVHNTDSIYINLPFDSSDVELSMRLSQEIAEQLNDLFRQYLNEYILNKLNVAPEHNFTFFKTELTADSIMFLETKKNYAFRATSIKNKPLPKPKVEYVGIPIVKVNTPKFSSDLIRALVEEIALEKIAKSEIQQKINEIAKKMWSRLDDHISNFDIDMIGSPGKWNNTTNDTSHVTGMRLYNSLVDMEVFKPLVSGYSIGVKIANKQIIDNRIQQVKQNSTLYLTDTTNINFISIPYNYDPKFLAELFKTYGLSIEKQETWDSLNNTVARRIIETIKSYAGL